MKLFRLYSEMSPEEQEAFMEFLEKKGKRGGFGVMDFYKQKEGEGGPGTPPLGNKKGSKWQGLMDRIYPKKTSSIAPQGNNNRVASFSDGDQELLNNLLA